MAGEGTGTDARASGAWPAQTLMCGAMLSSQSVCPLSHGNRTLRIVANPRFASGAWIPRRWKNTSYMFAS